jgi:hypothetical protein
MCLLAPHPGDDATVYVLVDAADADGVPGRLVIHRNTSPSGPVTETTAWRLPLSAYGPGGGLKIAWVPICRQTT